METDDAGVSVMTTHIHMQVCIEGALRNRSFSGYTDDSGRSLTRKQARQGLLLLQAKGHKYMPLGECPGFDPFGKGCPGHPDPIPDTLIHAEDPVEVGSVGLEERQLEFGNL